MLIRTQHRRNVVLVEHQLAIAAALQHPQQTECHAIRCQVRRRVPAASAAGPVAEPRAPTQRHCYRRCRANRRRSARVIRLVLRRSCRRRRLDATASEHTVRSLASAGMSSGAGNSSGSVSRNGVPSGNTPCASQRHFAERQRGVDRPRRLWNPQNAACDRGNAVAHTLRHNVRVAGNVAAAETCLPTRQLCCGRCCRFSVANDGTFINVSDPWF